MNRHILSEASSIKVFSPVGVFANGDTMSITVYKDGSSTPESLTAGTLTELGSTGIFFWPFSDLVNAPTALSQYYWTMQDTTTKKSSGSEIFGGYPNDISSVSGANQVTITVEETDTTPIASVEVQILNAAQDTVLDRKLTDVNGDAVFALDDGSYKARLTKPQVTFTVPEDLTVSGTTVDTYNGTLLTITSVAGVNECEVSIYVSSQRPTIPLLNLSGTAQIKVLPTLLSSVYYSGEKIDGSFDSTNKRMFFVLPQGAIVEFLIKDILGTTKVSKLIPATATANFQDLEAR